MIALHCPICAMLCNRKYLLQSFTFSLVVASSTSYITSHPSNNWLTMFKNWVLILILQKKTLFLIKCNCNNWLLTTSLYTTNNLSSSLRTIHREFFDQQVQNFRPACTQPEDFQSYPSDAIHCRRSSSLTLIPQLKVDQRRQLSFLSIVSRVSFKYVSYVSSTESYPMNELSWFYQQKDGFLSARNEYAGKWHSNASYAEE